jgi:hypothetical protein
LTSDDETRIPAASPNLMERGMMRLLAQVLKAAHSGTPIQVHGLRVLFSLEGDADVAWEVCTIPHEPAP